MKQDNKTDVIYRIDKHNEVIAVFPYEIQNGFLVSCFTASESHSACDYQHIIRTTKPAKEEDYKYLNRILWNFYGYETRILKKYSHAKYLKAYYKHVKSL